MPDNPEIFFNSGFSARMMGMKQVFTAPYRVSRDYLRGNFGF
jgi:hypothetical protein